jgi:hypothetical protein
MIPILANATVQVSSGNGQDTVVVDPPFAIGALYLFLLLLPLLVLLVLLYYKAKFRHQQILSAMEKGLPVSDLIAKPASGTRTINWIRSLSAGVGLIFIGIALAVAIFATKAITSKTPGDEAFGFLLIPTLIFGTGLVFLLRGILQRNYEKAQKTAA